MSTASQSASLGQDTLQPIETIVLSSQDHLIVNAEITPLPYITDGLIVFRASSTHTVLYSDFGLEVVLQRFPVFSVYLTVQSSYGGSTKGLCGNFNKDTNDDFMSSSGIPEGSVTVFVDSWRASPNPHLCTAARNKDINPCSMSVSNELCAETHCSELLRAPGVFAVCHSMVDPEPYYKRCVYAGCNYQETYAFICESLGSYARMCASKAVFIGDWRTSTNCTVPCTGNQTFSYNTEACGRTCQSLSNRQYECYTPDIPLDGCNCPDGYYLDHLSKCVKSSQCPCYLPDNIILLPNYKSTIDGRTCYCMNGKLNCFGKPSTGPGVCNAPMEYKTCGTGAQKWGAACAPSCQMKATGIRCIPTRCEAGCVCPAGLLEDLDGKCVDPDDCSCEYGGNIYPTGNVMQKDCQSCLCTGGQWKCTENLKCASTCVLYGEGHVNTFDGQQFVFDGNCEYALVTDGCGVNNSLSTFKIVTENVVCGRLGVTCSRAIRISIGATILQLSEEDYTITPNVHDPNIRVSKNNLFMTFDITIPGRFIISLLWNKNMNVFIKLFKLQQDAICGLCGNYNGNQKDDYETRSKYVAPNMLSFVNSWKENPVCGDVNYVVDPCSKNPYRSVWAQKNCAIINSKTFDPCHSLEYQGPYYEACLHDACGCDSGGDCECLCDAIAAYAKKCLDKGVCIDWRRPDFCPVYCDYENTHTQVGTSNTYVYSGDVNCTWHYQPCQCPFTPHSYPLSNTEGCYKCTPEQYYNPEEGKCVPCVYGGSPNTSTTKHINNSSSDDSCNNSNGDDSYDSCNNSYSDDSCNNIKRAIQHNKATNNTAGDTNSYKNNYNTINSDN
ncbi:mucin-6 [Ambystoma mexicanum]|uniref:mucin-6 n=1 Tax=Ambystoma mexicanum TaxID=8296 RepID=UPI0037E93F15